MNLKAHHPKFKVWAGAQADIERVTAIWRQCLEAYGGPFLFGSLTAADAMYAPVCSRFVTYDVTLDAACVGYMRQHHGMAGHGAMDRGCAQRARGVGRAGRGVLKVRDRFDAEANHGFRILGIVQLVPPVRQPLSIAQISVEDLGRSPPVTRQDPRLPRATPPTTVRALALSCCGLPHTACFPGRILLHFAAGFTARNKSAWEEIHGSCHAPQISEGSGAGALAAKAGGMAGILATGRAPAYAQATTVHWLRWNDFVPASDQLLRKEMLPEAEKALGIKINFETVNGNDLQPRITSAIQSGAGPDLIMLFNNHPQLYAESVVDMSDIAEVDRQGRGRLLPSVQVELQRRQEVDLHAVDHRRRHDRLPQIVVRRGRLTTIPRHLGEVSRGRQEAEGQGPADRPDARPHLRRRADVHATPIMWSWGGKEVEKDGKTVDINRRKSSSPSSS